MNKEQKINEVHELREEIIRAFSNVPHPGSPEKIIAFPCCPEHDAIAEWFSLHTWQELEEALEKEDLDLASYGSLYPEAFLYYLPAILIYIIQNIDRDPESDSWGTKSWRPMDRIYHTICPWPRSKEKWSQELRSEYLPLFSVEQRKTVVRVLEFVCDFGFIPDEDKEESIADMQTAIKDIWKISK
jgi:hypothetical protein